jgi:hypothetical protein
MARIIDEYGLFAVMKIGRGNRNTRSKPAIVQLCPPHDDLVPNPDRRVWKPATNRLTYCTSSTADLLYARKGMGDTHFINQCHTKSEKKPN